MLKLNLFIIFILFFSFSNFIIAGPPIQNKKNALSEVNNQIQSLKKIIDTNQQQEINLQQDLKTTELSISDLAQQLNQLNMTLKKEKTALNNLSTTENQVSLTLNNQYQALAVQLRSAYELGQAQQWEVLLNQKDLSSTNRYLMYYHYLTQSRLKLISNIKQNKDHLAKTIQNKQTHQEILKNKTIQKQDQQIKQQNNLKFRQQLITELNNQTKSKQKQLEILLSNQKNLQETISKLQTQTSSLIQTAPFKQLKGKLSWPVQGDIIANFGSKLDIGDQRLLGVIIKTPNGTPVHAIYSGKIIFSTWLRGFGLLIIINHGDNYLSLYARNQTLNAKVGDFVKTGDVIATTGNSGGYNKSSLYFEIRQNTKPVNPTTWCRL